MTAARRHASLLGLDPELGQLLTDERRAAADQHMLVQMHTLEVGPWDAERLRAAGPEHVGLLITEGLLAREVVLADNVSCELLGPGDIIRPWQHSDPAELVRAEVRWTVLDAARLAVLDRRIAVQLTRFPEINAMIIDRLAWRTQRLAVAQAASQLNGVDRRLLALFWHMAERWGRVVPQGIALTLPIPHRLIAELVGARRPTVSTALGRLAANGELVREGDTWLLSGEPVGMPEGEAARVIRGRRRRIAPAVPEAGPEAGPQEALPATGRIRELHEELEAVREQTRRRREDWATLEQQTHGLIDRLGRDRERRKATRSG